MVGWVAAVDPGQIDTIASSGMSDSRLVVSAISGDNTFADTAHSGHERCIHTRTYGYCSTQLAGTAPGSASARICIRRPPSQPRELTTPAHRARGHANRLPSHRRNAAAQRLTPTSHTKTPPGTRRQVGSAGGDPAQPRARSRSWRLRSRCSFIASPAASASPASIAWRTSPWSCAVAVRSSAGPGGPWS